MRISDWSSDVCSSDLGIVGAIDDKAIVLGNANFLEEYDVDLGALTEAADRLRGDGATAIYIAGHGKAAGVIAIADPVTVTTGAALAALRAARIKVIIARKRVSSGKRIAVRGNTGGRRIIKKKKN